MPREYPRRYRVADQLQRELGELVRAIKDPGVTGWSRSPGWTSVPTCRTRRSS
ncbi:MAG: hypothetical protein U5K43_00525 [Halofilum sp. (in: g-proteobacteria)]|nr:hypothetical protein [Halofilum sp. (in: g-proteobacteria)]